MSDDGKYCAATPRGTLLEQIMDSNQPKNDREWAAADEIERKDAAIAELLDALLSAINQVEYLHVKFQETGSGNGMIAGWKQLLAKHDTPKEPS